MIKKILRGFLILCILISFFLFLKSTDVGESIRLVKQLELNSVIIFVCTFFAYCFGTSGWKYCIDSDVKLSPIQLYMIRHTGNVISIFNPSGPIAGEIYNATMLIHRGVAEKVAYASVLLSRIMMILSQLTILLVVVVWFLFVHSDRLSETLRYTFYGCFCFFILTISALLYFLLKNGEEIQYSRTDTKWRKVIRLVKEMRNSLAEYIRRRPQKAALAYLSFVLQWILLLWNFISYKFFRL